MGQPFERWNTHFSTTVEQTVFDINFQLAQDPSSHNLGTTVWDASIVLAKYLEKNARKGEFSRIKVRGKRAIELGAGTGLAGMAFAILGADVTLTDIGEEVLNLLRRNVEQNVSPAALKLSGSDYARDGAGICTVSELDWENPSHYKAVQPPFDYILAADCVYNEKLVPPFLNAVLAVSGPKTHTIIVNEFRSSSVQEVFMAEFSKYFLIKKVTPSRMHDAYQHPLIHIYTMKRRKESREVSSAPAAVSAVLEQEEEQAVEEQGQNGNAVDSVTISSSKEADDTLLQGLSACTLHIDSAGNDTIDQQHAEQQRDQSLETQEEEAAEVNGVRVQGKDSEREAKEVKQFATRRQGAMLARTLNGVQL